MLSSSGFFPLRVCQALWEKAEPRDYPRTVGAADVIQSLLIAFVARLSGLRAIVARCHQRLHTASIASLCEALRRPSSLRFCELLVRSLQTLHRPRPMELVALDSMAVTLPATQRHRCAKFNDKTAGGGVLWAYMVEAARGVCPVQVLRVVDGAWHDSRLMRGVALASCGPVYLMDRGFYALDLLEHWLEKRVHFIVRAKRRSLVWEDLVICGAKRRAGDVRIVHDALVRLGGPRAKAHPVVRLVIARLANGDELIVVSSLWDWTAEALLAAYKKRGRIEGFHRLLKESVGLAHLYSFHRVGLRLLAHAALLVALLLFIGSAHGGGDTCAALHAALAAVRAALGLGPAWKRNTLAPRRAKKRPKGRRARGHNP